MLLWRKRESKEAGKTEVRYEMITPQHEKWLKDNMGLTFQEIEGFSHEKGMNFAENF